ncbi:MAG TPA: class I SAM-dependent methyltransferase [Pseudonocardia sp.]|jgi:predicted O-methyltransferase YrrM|uniref:O-methyltransferase n=1 Tax=Pseudonocardia sp. TaxID=60912 RepID=UPI002F3F2845
MDSGLRAVLRELYDEGQSHDAGTPDRTRRRRNLEPDAAEFLRFLLLAVHARQVVEIGTSNGYSTLWLADAVARTGGRLLSVDLDAEAQREAEGWLGRAGLAGVVELRAGDGGEVLRTLPPGTVDVLFLDAERTEYPGWWDAIQAAPRDGGLIVVDNAISHADEVAPLRQLLDEDPGWTVTLLHIGKGELLAVRTGAH